MDRRVGLPLTIALKALVIGLTALGAFGGLERFEEKGFGWRLLWYPIAVLALPVVWRFFFRDRAYPYAADVLLAIPFFVDVMGNVLDLYDTIGDMTFGLTGSLLAAAVTYAVARRRDAARDDPARHPV